MKDLIDELGCQLLRQALGQSAKTAGSKSKLPDSAEEMTSKDRVDIFKATSLWHLGLNRKAKPEEEDVSNGETFDKIAKRINGKGAAHQ